MPGWQWGSWSHLPSPDSTPVAKLPCCWVHQGLPSEKHQRPQLELSSVAETGRCTLSVDQAERGTLNTHWLLIFHGPDVQQPHWEERQEFVLLGSHLTMPFPSNVQAKGNGGTLWTPLLTSPGPRPWFFHSVYISSNNFYSPLTQNGSEPWTTGKAKASGC